MNKVAIIIKREYLSRVKKPSFKYLTLLVPIIFYMLISGSHKLSQNAGRQQKIYVVDDYHLLNSKSATLIAGSEITYANKTLLSNWKRAITKNDVLVYIPADFDKKYLLQIYTGQALQPQVAQQVKQIAQNAFMERLLADTKVSPAIIKRHIVLSEHINNGTPDTAILLLISFGLAFSVYLAIFLYGTQVLRSVIEEKSSRIVEIIVSSVRPFELMAGKIVGVGLVGLTQFAVWVLAMGYFINKTGQTDGYMQLLSNTISSQQLISTGCYFLIYFLFGYFLYSALFAAVGAAIDNETESQQFMLPITAPLIFTIALAKSYIIDDPYGPVAHWLSIIPLTSPIAMVMRLPFGVPIQELVLSLSLLMITFICITWIAARIYRVGILNYGNEVSYKNLWKWALRSN